MFLGLDLGTTNVKALITDRTGRSVAQASVPVQLYSSPDGCVEQDIDEIEGATFTALRQAAGNADPSKIEAIGVSSQGGAMHLTDPKGQAIGRIVSWLDERGHSYDEALTIELGGKWFVEHVGRGRSGLAIGQIMRLRNENPEWIRAPNCIRFVGDWIVSRLCGHAAYDGSSCSLTQLYNPGLRTYDPELLERLGLERTQLPAVIAAAEPAGALTSDVATSVGLRAGIPVSAAVHDQYASALACGAVNEGTVMVGTGTAWILLAVGNRLAPPVHTDAFVCHHVVDGLWGQILSLVNGGSSFAWALKLLGLAGSTSHEVESTLKKSNPGSGGLVFWPFMAAEATACVRGTHGRLAGLRLAHGPPEILRAVLEGLSFELNRYLGFLRAGTWPVERLVVGGAAATSPITAQILADVTGLPLLCQDTGSSSLRGAVILARALAEPGASLSSISAEMALNPRRVDPGSDAAYYQEVYRRYLSSLPLRREML